MHKLIKSTFITKNSIELISKITKDLCDLNMLRSQMIRYNHLFILQTECLSNDTNLINSIVEKYTNNDLLDMLPKYKDNIINIKNYDQFSKSIFDQSKAYYNYYNKYKDMKKAEININLSNSPKIVYHSIKILSDFNIDIETLNSNNYCIPLTENKLFYIDMKVNIPMNGTTIKDVGTILIPLKKLYGANIIIK